MRRDFLALRKRQLARKPKDYDVHLDPSSRKYICPRCGKKTFVVYLDRNNQIIDPHCGRCDRQDKCAHHAPPREFSDRNRKLTHHSVATAPTTPSAMASPPPPAPAQPDYIPQETAVTLISGDARHSVLFMALTRKWVNIHPDAFLAAFDKYLVVGDKDGNTLFPQVDRNSKMRTVKCMGYKPNAHRNGHILWLHKQISPTYRLSQAYFGTHLLADDDAVIILVESEKTAVILDAYLSRERIPPYCILATGGCGGFNPSAEKFADPYNAMQALRGRRVLLLPDHGKYEEWKQKGVRLVGFAKEVCICNLLEPDRDTHSIAPPSNPLLRFVDEEYRRMLPRPQGSDIADLLEDLFDFSPLWRHLPELLTRHSCHYLTPRAPSTTPLLDFRRPTLFP